MVGIHAKGISGIILTSKTILKLTTNIMFFITARKTWSKKSTKIWYLSLLLLIPLDGGEIGGEVSYFNSVSHLERAYTDVGLAYDWSVSHVETYKRICNFFNRSSIPFYESFFSRLKFRLTSNYFEKMKHFQITLSQLHSLVWEFFKMFQNWCEFTKKKKPSLNLFFNIFTVKWTSLIRDRGSGLLSLFHLVKVFDVYLEVCKNFKGHYFLVTL